MCGRYVLKASGKELAQQLALEEAPAWSARFNIAPMQAAPIVIGRRAVVAQWGLLPAWAKDVKLASKLINARSETLASKPAFKELLSEHRCVVPSDGFYEWRREGAQRVPHFIHRADGKLLCMAGLWSRWRSPAELEVVTFTIITTPASAALQGLHDRMPAFLDDEARQRWLSGPTTDVAALEALLKPWHGSPLEIMQVSPHVNSVAADDERCVLPAQTVQLRLL